MKITYLFCTMMLALVFAACNVNDAYDLGNIDDENIAFGTDETLLTAPIVEYKISYAEIQKNAVKTRVKADSLALSLFSDVFNWVLPSTSVGVDIKPLTETDNSVYVSGLTNELVGEIAIDEVKRFEFSDVILSASAFVISKNMFFNELNLVQAQESKSAASLNDLEITPEEFSDKLGLALNSDPAQVEGAIQALKDDLAKFAREELSESTNFSYSSVLAGINGFVDMDSDIMDVFIESLGVDVNEILIFYEPTTDDFFDISIDLSLSGKTFVYDPKREQYVYKITSEKELRDLLNNFQFVFDAELETIFPSTNQKSLEEMFLNLKFTLNKDGALWL